MSFEDMKTEKTITKKRKFNPGYLDFAKRSCH